MLIYPCGYYIWVHMPKFIFSLILFDIVLMTAALLHFSTCFPIFAKHFFFAIQKWFFFRSQGLSYSNIKFFLFCRKFQVVIFFFNSTLVIVEYQATYLNLHISKILSNFGLILFIVRNLVYFTSSTLPLFYFFSLMLSQLSYFSHFLLLNCY